MLRSFVISFLVLALCFSILIVLSQSKSKPSKTTKNTHNYASLKPLRERVIPISKRTSETPITVRASTLPKFAVSLSNNKFDNVWRASGIERTKLVEASFAHATGNSELDVNISFSDTKKEVLVAPEYDNKVKPGLYTLSVKVKTATGVAEEITQDFTWGVLAINTNKALYRVGEDVNIGMAVLGDYGRTKCIATGDIQLNTAKVWLTITSPTGKVTKLSTEDGSIWGSGDCKDRSVTNKADFLSRITANEVGTYQIQMDAEHYLGKRSIQTSFVVEQNEPKFEIERTKFPTRIYPKVDYPVTVTIKSNEDFSGYIHDIVPKNFKITHISNGGVTENTTDYQAVGWETTLKKGKTYHFSYTIHFPQVAPEFYLVGPFTIGTFTEKREWKIASDSIFQLVQETHNNGSGTSVSATLPSAPTQRNLVLVMCYRTNSATFNTPSGFTLAYNNSTSNPRAYMFYRVVPTGMSATVTCSGSSGTLGIQILEFSGNSTSSVRDRRARRNAFSCSTGAHQSATSNITPANPDELVVAAFAATGTTSVGSHLSDYADTAASFNGSTGTFDSSWSEQVNNPPVSTHDTATYNASGGTCANIIVSFNPTVTVSQGSYQFFENTDAVDPITVFGGTATENSPITLSQPGYAFRLRILLDVDSPSGTIVDVDSGDWILMYAPLPSSGDCADGTYNPVGTQADGTPIAYNPNPNSGGNNAIIGATANDPTDTGYTTRLEDYAETWLSDGSEDITNHNLTMGNNQAGLFDFSLIDNTDDSVSTTYCLVVANGDQSLLDAYRNYPKVTTIPLDVNIKGGTTITGGTTIQ